MSDTEIELIQTVRNSDNPDEALVTAILIIINYLKQLESSVVPAFADPPVHG
jgi:hypothetical protein